MDICGWSTGVLSWLLRCLCYGISPGHVPFQIGELLYAGKQPDLDWRSTMLFSGYGLPTPRGGRKLGEGGLFSWVHVGNVGCLLASTSHRSALGVWRWSRMSSPEGKQWSMNFKKNLMKKNFFANFLVEVSRKKDIYILWSQTSNDDQWWQWCSCVLAC